VCSYCPPCHGVLLLHYEMTTLLFSLMFLKNFPPSCKMKKRNEKSNTGESVKDKRGRTVSDDAGGIDKVKDKRRTKGNNLEFLIGWRGFPDPKDDTWESLLIRFLLINTLVLP
jgi:hypothetical protein